MRNATLTFTTPSKIAAYVAQEGIHTGLSAAGEQELFSYLADLGSFGRHDLSSFTEYDSFTDLQDGVGTDMTLAEVQECAGLVILPIEGSEGFIFTTAF